MPIRFIWAASLAILLPLCGCGDGKSNASVLAMNDRKLLVGIIQANVEREAAGLPDDTMVLVSANFNPAWLSPSGTGEVL